MPKKVILSGEALKLLGTFIQYGKLFPVSISEALDYDTAAFEMRIKLLAQQMDAGKRIEWSDLDRELDAMGIDID